MFYHLKIIWRNLRSNGIYSVINVAGLATGLTACILIMFWMQGELSFNKFHKRSKDIFQTNVYNKALSGSWDVVTAPLAFAAKAEIPEIENACRYYAYWGPRLLKTEEGEGQQVVLDFSYGMVDSTFFSIFDFPVLEGDARRMLVDPQSIVLSARIAATNRR